MVQARLIAMRNEILIIAGAALVVLSLAVPISAQEIKPGGEAKPVPLALCSKGGEICLFAAVNDSAMDRAVATWKSFFEERGGIVQVVPAGNEPKFPGAGAIMAFESEDICPVARQMKADLGGLKDTRPESHLLLARNWNNRPLVLVVGKTSAGTDCGAARLLSKVACWDGKISIQPGEELNKPFIDVRENMLCPSPDYDKWPTERLSAYPKFLKACGFNSVQIAEILAYWGHKGMTRKKEAPALRAVAESAHKNGMLVSQFIWGCELVADTNLMKISAATYADVVDHLITHWGDPGAGGYEVPQRMTMALLDEYRKINPKARATVSTWANHKFWNGDRKAPAVLDETYSSKEIGIALHRWYDADGPVLPTDHYNTNPGENPKRGDLVLKAGRRLGIWGWYLGDHELGDGDYLRTRLLDKYFSSLLPPDVSTKVDWISVEKVHHGNLSRINQFIAGQKMWNPKQPLREIMMDYCRSMYGPVHASTVCDAIECAEAKGPQKFTKTNPPSDEFPDVTGDAAFSNRLDQVWVELQKVQLPADWKPNFPDVGSVRNDIKELLLRCKPTKTTSK